MITRDRCQLLTLNDVEPHMSIKLRMLNDVGPRIAGTRSCLASNLIKSLPSFLSPCSYYYYNLMPLSCSNGLLGSMYN